MENNQITELIKDLTIELDWLSFSLKETPSLELEIKAKLIKNILNKLKAPVKWLGSPREGLYIYRVNKELN